jgi:hypothetical protein
LAAALTVARGEDVAVLRADDVSAFGGSVEIGQVPTEGARNYVVAVRVDGRLVSHARAVAAESIDWELALLEHLHAGASLCRARGRPVTDPLGSAR